MHEARQNYHFLHVLANVVIRADPGFIVRCGRIHDHHLLTEHSLDALSEIFRLLNLENLFNWLVELVSALFQRICFCFLLIFWINAIN